MRSKSLASPTHLQLFEVTESRSVKYLGRLNTQIANFDPEIHIWVRYYRKVFARSVRNMVAIQIRLHRYIFYPFASIVAIAKSFNTIHAPVR